MCQPERFFITFIVAGLLFVSGDRAVLAETPDGDPVTFTSTEPETNFLRLSGCGKALCDPGCKSGSLWNAIPIWRPYVETNFRGGGITERGELDLFLPLSWSDSDLLFADLRGSIGDTGAREGNWAVGARTLTSSDWILGA